MIFLFGFVLKPDKILHMTATLEDIYQILLPYQKIIDRALACHVWPAGSLGEAIRYALSNGGKRFRPAIVLMICRALKSRDLIDAALSIEYFHTASLIADDLPCMDDDDERRGKPSLHRVYGEGVSLLASYTLISEGYASVARASDNPVLVKLALECASYNTLLATEGQHLDLFPPDDSEKNIREALRKKTVSLFEIAFVFGWLFGGGDINRLTVVKQAAHHFGMAFQIADDIADLKQDKNHGVNLAMKVGSEKAIEILRHEMESCLNKLSELGLGDSEVAQLVKTLDLNGL